MDSIKTTPRPKSLQPKKYSQSKSGKPIDKNKPFTKRGPFLSPLKGSMIAVTGGIGSGKTFVLNCFEKLGFVVFNADKSIHEMLKKDGKAFADVAKLFPTAVSEEGIERKILSQEILKAPEKLKSLEQILHPMVRQAQLDLIVNIKNTSGKSIVFEIPLLFENKREKYYNFVVSCIVPAHIQKERALARKNMTEEKFNDIVKRQVPDKVRIKNSHFIIKTGKTPQDTIKQVKAIILHDRFREPAERINRNSTGY